MWYLHRSNRIENLSDALIHILRDPLPSPFLKEKIVVASPGLERWLRQRLANGLGIAAHMEFPFPARAIREWMGEVLHIPLDKDAWSTEHLTWLTLQALKDVLHTDDAFEIPCAFLQRDPELKGRDGWQLASRLAKLYDRYLTYRPAWIRDWERGKENHWQAILWRQIQLLHTEPHLVTQFDQLQAQLRSKDSALPHRILLFGLSTLPPLYFDILHQLSQHTDVHFFLLSLTPEYMGDVQSKRERARNRQSDLETTNHHPLLASSGKLPREFQGILEEVDYLEPELAIFEAPKSDTCLHIIQRGLYEVAIPEESAFPTDFDGSLTIHACHGPTRQVEVLRDLLLHRFNDDHSLEPSDVMVLCPDLENYTSLIESVFHVPPESPLHIPFHIADRTRRSTQPVWDAFLRLLEVLPERATSTRLTEFLSLPAISRAFELELEDLDRLRHQIASVGICWGMNGVDRARDGLPSSDANTWRFGLDRLLLGYAFGEEDQPDGLKVPTTPWADVEGHDATLVGHLANFIDAWDRFRTLFWTEASLAEWSNRLIQLVDVFFANADTETSDVADLRQAILQWFSVGDPELILKFESVSLGLSECLMKASSTNGFLSGRLTFASLTPMRAVPARVVVLLGLDEHRFPRGQSRIPMDLTKEKHQRGDRSPRDDDRYTFLEALLSARDAVDILYTGFDPHSNDVRPPANVVLELLETLPAVLRAKIVISHAIQRFSPSSFQSSLRYRSFDSDACAGANALKDQRNSRKGFLDALTPDLEEKCLLADFQSFFRDPARALFEQRLKLSSWRRGIRLQEREPLEPTGLEHWELRDRFVRALLDGKTEDELCLWARGAGRLPPGAAGEQFLQTELQNAIQFHQIIKQRIQPSTPLLIDLSANHFKITGTIEAVGKDGIFRYSATATSGAGLLRSWIELLVASISLKRSLNIEHWFFESGQAMKYRMSSPAQPETHISDLISWYQRGNKEILAFEPKFSYLLARSNAFPEKKPFPLQLDGILSLAMRLSGSPIDWVKSLNIDNIEEPRKIAKAIFGPLLTQLRNV